MSAHQLTLLAVIGTAVCWGAFALAWLLGAIFYEPKAPGAICEPRPFDQLARITCPYPRLRTAHRSGKVGVPSVVRR